MSIDKVQGSQGGVSPNLIVEEVPLQQQPLECAVMPAIAARREPAPAQDPAPAQETSHSELKNFWEKAVKVQLPALIKEYPFLSTVIMLSALFFGMMNIVTFSPSGIIGSALLLTIGVTLAISLYYSIKAEDAPATTILNLANHIMKAITGGFSSMTALVSPSTASKV